MLRRKGFTLIELLVVISIIALLLAILMPALGLVKEKATGAVCLANQRGLIQGYVLYCGDYDDKLPIANIRPGYNSWVHPPTLENGTIVSGGGQDVTLEDRLRGIRNGAMYTYGENVKLYRCIGDKRLKRGTQSGTSDAYKMYRTYNIQGGLNGEEPNGYKRHSKIARPSETYVFVEENYDGTWSNNNGGSWQLGSATSGGPEDECWWNATAIWHNEGSTLSYADGHAESFKWKDDRTVLFATDRGLAPFHQPDNEDLEMMVNGYGVELPR